MEHDVSTYGIPIHTKILKPFNHEYRSITYCKDHHLWDEYIEYNFIPRWILIYEYSMNIILYRIEDTNTYTNLVFDDLKYELMWTYDKKYVFLLNRTNNPPVFIDEYTVIFDQTFKFNHIGDNMKIS